LKAITVFAGARPGRGDRYVDVARATGTLLARSGVTIVFGGGRRGLMGVLATAAIAAGGRVIGVIPRALQAREDAFEPLALAELHVVESMHERKALLASLGEGFLALPGGFGTLEELCEMTTWSQLGIHAKPVVLLDVDGFYAPLLAMFDRATRDGFIDSNERPLVATAPDPASALAALERFRAPAVRPWLAIEQA